MVNAIRDENHVPVMTGVSSSDPAVVLPIQINPVTGRVLTDNTGGGTGTVTDVSVVTANGISGTVATSTTTPAITLSLANITPNSVTVTPLTDRQAGTFRRNSAGQTSHIIDVQTEANAPLGNIDKDGNITMNNLSGTNTGDNATNSQYSGLATSKANQLTPTDTKIANYNAQPNEIIPCNISAGSIAITLPSAPADGTRVRVQLLTVGADKYLEVKTSGTDKFFATLGPTSLYMYLYGETQEFQYQTAQGFWGGVASAPTSNFANNFPGVDSITPITNANVVLDATARTITVTPPLGFFNCYVDGNGKSVKYRKSTVVFGDGSGTSGANTMTDTSGMWYFYINSAGQPVSSQTAWTTADFSAAVPIYRLLWNATLYSLTVTAANATKGATYSDGTNVFTVLTTIAGATTLSVTRTTGTGNPDGSTLTRQTGTGDNTITFSAFSEAPKAVSEYIEYHLNDIAADTHQWFHLQGTQWVNGFTQTSAPLTSGTPATNGSNTVVSLSTGTNVDDNLEYTVTNSTAGTAWTQDMGATTTPNNTNGGVFQIFSQNAGGLVWFIPASRFPFAFNATTNFAEYVSSVGVQTTITSTNFFVCFLYATQNPRTGEPIKAVMYPGQFTNSTNASAINWIDIQNTYSILNEGEIRPLYRLIYEHRTSYNAGNKFAALRAVQDLRKAAITSSATATGSLPASSVTFVPAGTIASTNVQSALEELDTEKVPTTRTLTINGIGYDLSADRTWTVAGGTGGGLPASWFLN